MTMNHSHNFVDPNTGTCTNAIEDYWSRVKRNVHLHWLYRRDQLPLRIDEFLWCNRVGSTMGSTKYCDVFRKIVCQMANN